MEELEWVHRHHLMDTHQRLCPYRLRLPHQRQHTPRRHPRWTHLQL
jgi:hypothetical protein